MLPRKHIGFLAVFCVLAASILLAQVVITSTILGSVTDPQGAVVPGAKVTLTNVDTGIQWKITTGTSGDYRFPNLIAGGPAWRIVAHPPGTDLGRTLGAALRAS